MGRWMELARQFSDGKVSSSRASQTISPDWLAEWRELASQTAGLLPDDPRLRPVLEGLSRCDEAFLANDYPGFLRAKAAVLALMNEVPRE